MKLPNHDKEEKFILMILLAISILGACGIMLAATAIFN